MTVKALNYGIIKDDDTGDELFDIYKDIDDNFQEIVAIGQGGPCTGTKYTALQKAIKYCWLNPVLYNNLYYIGKIIAGTAYQSNQLTYTIEVRKSTTPSEVGVLVGSLTVHVSNSAPKTAVEMFYISKTGGNVEGAVDGFFVVDWSKLTLGATYFTDNWTEGALMAINTQGNSTVPTGGGGGGIGITVITDDATVNGSTPFLKLNPPNAEKTITLDDFANFVGAQTLKNVSVYNIAIVSNEDLLIDGFSAIILGPRDCITICADEGQGGDPDAFIVTQGNYTEIT